MWKILTSLTPDTALHYICSQRLSQIQSQLELSTNKTKIHVRPGHTVGFTNRKCLDERAALKLLDIGNALTWPQRKGVSYATDEYGFHNRACQTFSLKASSSNTFCPVSHTFAATMDPLLSISSYWSALGNARAHRRCQLYEALCEELMRRHSMTDLLSGAVLSLEKWACVRPQRLN